MSLYSVGEVNLGNGVARNGMLIYFGGQIQTIANESDLQAVFKAHLASISSRFQGVDFKSIDKKLAMLFVIDIGMLNVNTSVP